MIAVDATKTLRKIERSAHTLVKPYMDPALERKAIAWVEGRGRLQLYIQPFKEFHFYARALMEIRAHFCWSSQRPQAHAEDGLESAGPDRLPITDKTASATPNAETCSFNKSV